MNDNDLNRLREAIWRGEVSPEEAIRWGQAEAWPKEVMGTVHLDARLGAALRGLPDVPASSNFVARVMQAIDNEEKANLRRTVSFRAPWWRIWLPRLAGAGVVAVVVCAGAWQYEQKLVRQQVVQSLQQVAALAAAPTIAEKATADVWQDFEVILRMGTVTPDEELLSVARVQ